MNQALKHFTLKEAALFELQLNYKRYECLNSVMEFQGIISYKSEVLMDILNPRDFYQSGNLHTTTIPRIKQYERLTSIIGSQKITYNDLQDLDATFFQKLNTAVLVVPISRLIENGKYSFVGSLYDAR